MFVFTGRRADKYHKDIEVFITTINITEINRNLFPRVFLLKGEITRP